MNSVRVNDVELAYATTGEPAPDGIPFVLVHGFMGNSRTWAPILPGISADRQVITYDHRGHGDSTNTGDPASYTFAQLVSDFSGFVDELGLERFHLLGHSMGGVVAMTYTIANPDRVASLIPMDTAPGAAGGNDDDPNAGFMRLGIEIAGTQGMQALFDHINGVMPDIPEVAEFREQLRHDLLSMDPHAFVQFGNELLVYPSFLDGLATLRMPATVIVGEGDANLREPAVAMADVIPGATLTVIENAAHNPHAENTAGWLAAVAAHFARLA